MLSLNLPVFDTKINVRNGKNVIFDVIRKRYVALTPEDWVRQHVVHFLIAAIRGEGTSNDYFPPEVPALPAFMLQRAVSSSIRDKGRDYWTGTVYTTNRRIWEHDDVFKEYLKKTRAMAVDMETATLFSCGFANHIPTGALLLVSDQPMTPDGVKTDKSDNLVTRNYVEEHVEIGIASLRMIIDEKKTVKHLKFDW